jgi:peptide/nickel transport system permease protein
MDSRPIATQVFGARRILWFLPLRAVRRAGMSVTVGCTLILVVLIAAFLAPLPHNPLQVNTSMTLQRPGSGHWFGTDNLGRDLFSRVIVAGRTDLPLALLGTVASLCIGVPFGLIASAKGKWSERLMRGLDMFQAFPLLILAIVIVTLAGNHLSNVVIAIAITNTPRFIRLVRAEALALRESRFIEAAIAIGASRTRVLARHMLPNVTGPILVQASLTAAQAIVLIAALSFLGIGITPPKASWGAMIQNGAGDIATGQWWISVFPGLAVFACVLSFNLIGEGLEQVFARGSHG